MEQVRDERVKQVAIAAGILISLAVIVPGVLVGWRYLPGLWGEWLGTMIGILTTPFFMEASFAILGLLIVIMLNHWRISRDGDEFVEMDVSQEADTGKIHARSQSPDPRSTNDLQRK